MASRHISVVVSEEQAEMLTQMAAEHGESLSSYVRGRIMAKDNLEEEFRLLQAGLIAAIHDSARAAQASTSEASTAAPVTTAATESGTGTPQLSGALIETLLHLRALGDPSKNRSIRAEVTRLGFTPFG